MLVVLSKFRIKLIGLAIQKSVKAIKTFLQRPVGVRACCSALFHWSKVPLACTQCCITFEPQYFGHCCCLRSDASAHIWKTCIPVGYTAHADSVMIATSQQTCARRRAQRCGVKARVTQTVLCKAIDIWRVQCAAKTTWVRKTHVVENDGDDVGPVQTLWQIWPCWCRCLVRRINCSCKMRFVWVHRLVLSHLNISHFPSTAVPILASTNFSHSVCKKFAMFVIAQTVAQTTALQETSWKSFCSAQEVQCQTPSVVAQQRW